MTTLIEGRLPTAVVPERYDVTLTVEPEQGRFSGSVAIQVTVRKPVLSIRLHALDLHILEATVQNR